MLDRKLRPTSKFRIQPCERHNIFLTIDTWNSLPVWLINCGYLNSYLRIELTVFKDRGFM